MKDSMLNLGPFNECVDIFDGGRVARYGPVCDDEVFCYSKEGTVSRIVSGSDEITVPMLTLGLSADHNTTFDRQKLIRSVELQVLNMIYQISSKCNIELKLSNVAIPIESVDFGFDARKRLCITAVLGVVMFEKSMTRILV